MVGGIAGALVAAIPGFIDMLSLEGGLKRIALTHMGINLTVVALYAGPAHPEVEYADASGQRHTFPGTGMVHHQAGARVGVLYIDRGDHHDARLAEWGSLWFSVCTTAGIGVALLIAGAYQIVSR